MKLRSLFVVCLLVSALNVSSTLAGQYNAPARFKVSADYVNEDLQPFTATVGAFGNEFVSTSFEPKNYRTMIRAEQDAADRIVGSATTLGFYDTVRDGLLDAAEIRVYRVVDGKMRIVRSDRVTRHHASGWTEASGKLAAPNAARFEFGFDGWNRPDVEYWFGVAAVDTNGNVSDITASEGVRRANPGKAGKTSNKLVRFKEPRRPKETDAPPAPKNVRGRYEADRDMVVLEWDAVEADDLAGYRIFNSDYAPETHKGYALMLEGKAAGPAEQIKAGDMIFVSKKFYTHSRGEMNSNRVWGANQANRQFMAELINFYPDEDPDITWSLDRYPDGPAEKAVPDGGETALKITGRDSRTVRLGQYAYGPSSQAWWDVLEPEKDYVVEVWLKQEGMDKAKVEFVMGGFYQGKLPEIVFEPTGRWKKYTARFRFDGLYDKGSNIGQMALKFDMPGTIWIDNFRVYQADAGYLGWMDYEKQVLKESGMMSLRTHGPIKTGTTTYSMEQFTNPPGVISGVGKGNTLDHMLSRIGEVGMIPWLQVEFHMSPAEWLGFVEYMAAPYDPAKDSPQSKPWAYKRFKQGRQKPWTQQWDRIYFELSNETWNWLFRPWVFEGMTDGATGERYGRGEVYGLFQEHVYDIMSSSPYWNEELDKKFVWMLGGWSRSTYGHDAASVSPHSDFQCIAAYNGGWDEGEGPAGSGDSSLFSILTQMPHTGHYVSVLNRKRRDAHRAAGSDYRLGTYEAGPGYALSGLNGQRKMTPEEVRAQEEAMKGQVGGTATLDTFLDKAYYDFDIQNYFTFYVGKSHWVSHSEWHKGVVPYPAWMVLETFNHHGTGDLLYVAAESVPTIDLPKKARRPATPGAPLAGCYATREGDRLSLFVVSRKIDGYPVKGDDGYTPVTVDLPFEKASKITLYRMAADPRAHNLDSKQVEIEKIEIPSSYFNSSFKLDEKVGADVGGLPPAATMLYVFEGIDMPDGKLVDPQGLDE